MERKTPEQIAKEKLEEINKAKKEANKNLDEKKKEESKGASPDSSAEKQKTEEQKKQELFRQQEEQAKKDEAILAKKDEDLNAEEKERKKVLLSKASEDKVEKRKQEIQKEIDELIAKKKSLEAEVGEKEKIAKEIEALKKEKEKLSKEAEPAQKANEAEEEAKFEAERIAKYLEEDKNLPREQRREMSKEDLEEWLLEDMVAAQEWIVQRTLRRAKEKRESMQKRNEEKFVKTLIEKQTESAIKTAQKHPELDTSKREAELQAEGKTKEEIHNILYKENQKYRICADIVKEWREKNQQLLLKENTPELVVAEMEKRLKAEKKKEPEKNVESETERLQKMLEEKEAEIARLKSLDTGINSSTGKELPPKKELSEFEKKQLEIAARAGIPKDKLIERIKRRKTIPGASVFADLAKEEVNA
jgi:hypothetical protein